MLEIVLNKISKDYGNKKYQHDSILQHSIIIKGKIIMVLYLRDVCRDLVCSIE